MQTDPSRRLRYAINNTTILSSHNITPSHYYKLAPTPPQDLLPLQYLLLKLDQKHRLPRPHALLFLLAHTMRRNALCREPRTITHTLNHARYECRAIEAGQLLR